MPRWFAILLLPALAACGAKPPARSTPVVVRTAPPPMAVPVVRPRLGPGPVAVIGRDARALIASFGQPRLDVQEPTVRKLQFANGSCVMDAYLYAPDRGKEPVATHVDARLPNGMSTDAARCAEGLLKK